MAAQANVVINNAAAAAHTFNPKGARRTPEGKDQAVWKDQTPVNAEGYLTITEHHSDPGKGPDAMEKFTWVISTPTLETVGTNDAGITPAPQKAYELVAVIEFRYPKRASATEVSDIYAYAKNFVALTMVKDAVEKREAAW
jgi:hypothetical protein